MDLHSLWHPNRRASKKRYGVSLILLGVTACVPALSEPPTPFSVPATSTDPPPTVEVTTSPSETPSPSATAQVPQPGQMILEPGSPAVIDQIRMDSATQGWGIGSASDTSGSIHVLKTDDGGQSWREVTPPEQRELMQDIGGWHSENRSAWVTYLGTGRVWRTTDGGSTWSFAEAGYPMGRRSEIEFADDRLGWMLQEVESGMGSQLVALFRTADGGISWQEIVNPYEDDALQSCRKTGMSFGGEQAGWVTYDCEDRYLEAFLDQSADGGTTWIEGVLPLPDGAPASVEAGWCSSRDPRLTSLTAGYLIVTCWTQGELSSEYLYHTQDSGEAWDIRSYPGGQPLYVDDMTVMAMGSEQFLTTDGGNTWTKLKEVTWSGVYDFVSPQIGWAVALDDESLEQALVFTSDGARTWQIIEPRISSP